MNNDISASDTFKRELIRISVAQSQKILREQGRQLTFDELLQEIYKKGFEHGYKNK